MNLFSNWTHALVWIVPSAGAVGLGCLAWFLWWRATRSRRQLQRVLKAISAEAASAILVPDGMGGQIWLDHLLLTARGLLVLDVKDVSGVIFGSDRMNEWAVIDGKRRYTFHNPQSALYDRVAAVKSLVRDVPVSGRIAFTSRGRFTKGIPRAVTTVEALEVEFGEPSGTAERITEAFYPHWQRVMRAATHGHGD